MSPAVKSLNAKQKRLLDQLDQVGGELDRLDKLTTRRDDLIRRASAAGVSRRRWLRLHA